MSGADSSPSGPRIETSAVDAGWIAVDGPTANDATDADDAVLDRPVPSALSGRCGKLQRFGCQSAISPPAGTRRMLRHPTGPSRGGNTTDAPSECARFVARSMSSTST